MSPEKLGRFRIATTGGRSVGNADFLGRPTLFYGWASWDRSREALGDVEAFHLKHAPDVVTASIAFDAEGPGRAMRYYAGVAGTHTPLVDATFTLRRVWGVTKLPFWILVDADGCIQERGESFSSRAIEKALARKPKHAKAGKPAARHRFERPEFLLQTAGTFLSRARIEDAVRCVKEAGSLDPECTFYRPQSLALAHPDRFYSGPIDLKWLDRQA